MLDWFEKKRLVSLFKWFGFGLLAHDYAHQVYQLKGYHNLVEGGYIGLAIFLLCIVVQEWMD